MPRLTIDLEEKLYEKIRTNAFNSRRSKKNVINEAIKSYFDKKSD